MNKVDFSGEGEEGKPGRIIVGDPSPTGDEVLDAALESLSWRTRARKPSTVIRPLSKNLRQTLYERLARERGSPRRAGQDPRYLPDPHSGRAKMPATRQKVRLWVTQALVQQSGTRHANRRAHRPRCTPSGANIGSSILGSTACPSGSSGRMLRRLPRATGHLRPFARRSMRCSPRSWPPPAPPRPPWRASIVSRLMLGIPSTAGFACGVDAAASPSLIFAQVAEMSISTRPCLCTAWHAYSRLC